jgi:hypothetical protein
MPGAVSHTDRGCPRLASAEGLKEADVLKVIREGKGKMKAVQIDDAPAVAKYVSGWK